MRNTVMWTAPVLVALCGAACAWFLLDEERSLPRPVAAPLPVAAQPTPSHRAQTAPELVRPAAAAQSPAVETATPAPTAVAPRAPAEVSVERVAELERRAEIALGEQRGDDALALLRELATLGPEAWPVAAQLLTRLARTIDDDNALGLSVHDFFLVARSGSFPELYLQALSDPNADPALRRMAVRELPWSGRRDVSERLIERLGLEQHPDIARRIAGVMVDRPDRRNIPGLVAALAQQKGPAARQAILEALNAIKGSEARIALATIAAKEQDPEVRRVADHYVRSRTATAPGYLVSGIVPGSQAEKAGLQPGDLITAYNGAALGSAEALEQAREKIGPQDRVALTVLREGRQLGVTITGPRMGVNGQFVRPA